MDYLTICVSCFVFIIGLRLFRVKLKQKKVNSTNTAFETIDIIIMSCGYILFVSARGIKILNIIAFLIYTLIYAIFGLYLSIKNIVFLNKNFGLYPQKYIIIKIISTLLCIILSMASINLVLYTINPDYFSGVTMSGVFEVGFDFFYSAFLSVFGLSGGTILPNSILTKSIHIMFVIYNYVFIASMLFSTANKLIKNNDENKTNETNITIKTTKTKKTNKKNNKK